MATWQADFHFEIDAPDLPDDYRERFSTVLPPGHSWSTTIELWGADDSDRIDVSRTPGEVPEISCRFDLREWKPDLYGRFIDCIRGIGGRLVAPDGDSVALEDEAFQNALRASPAERFVTNPEAFLNALRKGT